MCEKAFAQAGQLSCHQKTHGLNLAQQRELREKKGAAKRGRRPYTHCISRQQQHQQHHEEQQQQQHRHRYPVNDDINYNKLQETYPSGTNHPSFFFSPASDHDFYGSCVRQQEVTIDLTKVDAVIL